LYDIDLGTIDPQSGSQYVRYGTIAMFDPPEADRNVKRDYRPLQNLLSIQR